MAAEQITEEQKAYVRQFIWDKYEKLFYKLALKYKAYFPKYMDVNDVVAETYIWVTKSFYYPYSFAKVEEQLVVASSIIKRLALMFPKKKNKWSFEQQVGSIDVLIESAPESLKFESEVEFDFNEKESLIKTFNFIKKFKDDRFDSKCFRKILEYLKEYLLEVKDFEKYSINDIIQYLQEKLYKLEYTQRPALLFKYKLLLKEKSPTMQVTNDFYLCCNLLLLNIRSFLMKNFYFRYQKNYGLI